MELKPTVQIQNGKIRGTTKKSVEGYTYTAFLGIPYAKPPVGDLRFKDPEPIEDWTGIKDTTKYGNACIQYNTFGHINGSEDCLYINVCVKSLNNVNELKPVMVWIHGGNFMQGCGSDKNYGPDYLLRKDIVFVSFNYRLGIFGFLNLEHEIAPGNQGIKDQLLALKWVKANIKNFGGDPDNVTLFGESAGAVAIQVLAFSPLSKGLFHKIINQSGSAHNTWVTIKNPKKYAFQLCTLLGKYTMNSEEMFKFLQALDAQRLVKVQQQVKKTLNKHHGINPFTLGVDDKSSNPILPIPPEKLIEQGIPVPYLCGHNSAEGLIYLIDHIDYSALKSDDFERIDRNFAKAINERAMEVLKSYELTVKDFRRMYFEDEKISRKNCVKLANALGDLNIIEGIHKFARIQAEKNPHPTYFYQFSYDGGLSLMRVAVSEPLKGCCHGDETNYLFHGTQRPCEKLEPGTASYKVMQNMIDFWTNFATYGTPNPSTSQNLPVKWEPLNDGNTLRYMDIDQKLQMKKMINKEQHFISAKALTRVT